MRRRNGPWRDFVERVMTGLNPIRYAVRQFARSPVFTAAAVLTLALGIGGTTAIFALIHAVMVRSLPVSDAARLYRIGDGDKCCVVSGPQDQWGLVSFPLYEQLKTDAVRVRHGQLLLDARRRPVRRQGLHRRG